MPYIQDNMTDIEQECASYLRDVVNNPDALRAERIKAAGMLLERTSPSLKTVHHDAGAGRVMVFVSAVAQAREVLDTSRGSSVGLERGAHIPEVAGSNPAPASIFPELADGTY